MIVLTASDDDELAVHSAQEGAEEYLVKSQLQGGNLRRTIRHVIERDRSAKALRESEKQLRGSIDTTPQCIKLISPDGTVLKMNPAGLRMVEADRPEAVIGHSVFPLIAPEFRDKYRAFHDAVIQGQSGTLRFDIVGRKGTRRSVECVAAPLPNLDGSISHLGITQDLTERRQAEERERLLLTEASTANAKFRAFFEQGPLYAGIMTLDGILIEPNRLALEACGYTRDQVVGKPFWECPWWNKSTQLVEQIKEATAQAAAGQIYRAELPYFVADGSQRITDFTLMPIRDEAGLVLFLVPLGADITEKRRLTAERDALLSRLQLHIERMPLAYVLFDADFHIVDWNPTAQRIFGYSREEMLGHGPPFEKFVPPSVWPQGEEVLNSIRSGDMDSHLTNDNLTKDGRTITCEWFNTPLFDDGGNFTGMLCLAQEVTGRKLLEAQLQQAQKMESVGHLAGGVAHDFNNLLTIIVGCCEVLESNESLTELGASTLHDIDHAAQRAASLTRQLLAFSRKQLLEPMVLNLNAVIDNIQKMFLRLITEDIDLICRLFPAIWPVRLDPGQIEQVLVNLVVNAGDAMPGGGRLTIETANVEWTEENCRLFPDRRPGRYVMIVVADTGSGVTPEIKSRMFDPFFTTKQAGKGTGLGLAVVHGIVKQSEGYIDVDSEPGVGTSIKLYFPAINERIFKAPPEKDHQPKTRGSETIVLVEDEDGVRELVRRNLEKQGYTVLDASNGQEAIEAVDGYNGPLHLIVTDVVMPVMGGRQLVDRLLPRYPDLKVLYVTGYADDAMLRKGINVESHGFLQKPFSPSVLAKKVRSVLDADACKANLA